MEKHHSDIDQNKNKEIRRKPTKFLMTLDNSLMHISKEFISDIRQIIEDGRRHANKVAGQIAIATYWNIGRRIVEEEQQGNRRAIYGTNLISELAQNLKQSLAIAMANVIWLITDNSICVSII